MNRIHSLLLLTLFATTYLTSTAQDTLPKFSLNYVGNNRVIIGWDNNYYLVKQISIQRSFDSLRNYTTILSVADPNARQNGFADTKAPNDHMFYRLFIVLDKGQFLFTAAKRPYMDTAKAIRTTTSIERSRDTATIATIKPVIPKRNDFIPSFYIYTNKDGFVFINLPDAERKKYHIKFYDNDDNFLFEIKSIREPALTLDKTNFMRSGWFKFELYNDDKLIEKNKLYLAKEF